MPASLSHKPYRVGRSRTGLGLFATKPIKKGTKIIRYFGPILDSKKKDEVFIRAIKDIEPGDEINYDYGTDYFKAYLKPIGCKCDACEKKRKKQRAEARAERLRLKEKAERKARREAEKLAESRAKERKAKAKKAAKANGKTANSKTLNGKALNGKHLNGHSLTAAAGRRAVPSKRGAARPLQA
jgi:hypothetical protein